MKAITLKAPHLEDPHLFFKAVATRPNTMLLESAEIVTKTGKQSLLGISCALKVTCEDLRVTLTPLSANGRALLALVARRLPLAPDGEGMSITYTRCPPNTDEETRLRHPGPLDALRAIREAVEPLGRIFIGGMVAFDFINDFEDFGDLAPGTAPCPDYCFYVYDLSVRVDHIGRESLVEAFAFDDALYPEIGMEALRLKDRLDGFTERLDIDLSTVAKPEFHPDLDDARFSEIVMAIKEHIVQGDAFQVVPSRTFRAPCPNPALAFACLKRLNPSPYMFYINDERFTLFGASPEFALRLDQQTRQIAISPIAGTRPRGVGPGGQVDPDLDARIELELRTDRKEVAEHLMLVDLARNDLARIAVPGTRQVSNLLHVDRYQSVMHLVSDVTATLRDGLDALHAYAACMNMGTLSGAPKIKAHELIYRYEGKKRGAYGGVVATLSADGSFDSCITIRSALVVDGVAQVQAGCGVTFDSVPAAECQETKNKARSVLSAIAIANSMEG
ncbi:MAG: anthranilate synthase component 1 [Succinivibrionaceae bacterium]|nr:anthranilate synthase component 1 [Succinivibrionaceae bacterium]